MSFFFSEYASPCFCSGLRIHSSVLVIENFLSFSVALLPVRSGRRPGRYQNTAKPGTITHPLDQTPGLITSIVRNRSLHQQSELPECCGSDDLHPGSNSGGKK